MEGDEKVILEEEKKKNLQLFQDTNYKLECNFKKKFISAFRAYNRSKLCDYVSLINNLH